MTTITVPVDQEMRDFSIKDKSRKQFTIDDDVFVGPYAITADEMTTLGDTFMALGADPTAQGQIDGLKKLLVLMLDGPSYETFVRRMGDKENPITLEQLNDVVMWLMEQHGMRPTQSSSNSYSESPNPGSGTSSTVTAPNGESILSDSLSTGS